jgi:hypothetical protein
MTTLQILIAVGTFLFFLPAILIFLLTTISAHSQIPFKLLDEMPDVPEEHKAAARASFKEALKRHDSAMIYDITSPYVMLFVLPFVKWEADKLPKFFSKWDNEVSINGDRYPWTQKRGEDGNWIYFGYKGDIPTGDTCVLWSEEAKDNVEVDAKTLAYWVGGKFHPRSFIARYVWLGIRNRASQAAADLGVLITDELKASLQTWGNPNVGEEVNGERVTGSFLRNVGEYYQLFAFHPVKVGWRRTHFGFKIGNVIDSEHRATVPAMPVAIGFSYRK